ncbi:hypothetical protein BLNAU_11037 [Blattamonas nauphoetae]|uniref:Uncharacterized protein n=1 Tax=Blattamonas nauphoetae TaxID=2049346 RepID=A0ABQ9XSU6_9EUKA|nr:hypothetical protein BLNAU_11037 [Blattamonas nauphoetae]
MSGSTTSVSHRRTITNEETLKNSQHLNHEALREGKHVSVIFDVCNSTFRLENLELFATTLDTAISLIRSSTFVVSRSEITSCPTTSPFVIGDSGLDSSVSVSIISCSHRSASNLPSLLPLVSGPPSLLSSIRTTSKEEGHSDGFGVGSLSIVGTGLKIDSADLVVGTGPLFDFGISNENGLFGVAECSVSLSASSLTNTTSMRLSSELAASCSFVTQRLIGVSISESTNHLCGTSCISLDCSGSSLLSNSSFSSCFTNEAPAPVGRPTQDSDKNIEIRDSESSQIFHDQGEVDENVHNLVWVTSCDFTNLLSGYDGGAAIFLKQYRADVVVEDSSFENCSSTFTRTHGGAVFMWHGHGSTADGKFYFTLFNCVFSNNNARYGGHLSVQCFSPVTVAQCTFKDSRSSTDTPLTQYESIRVSINGSCRFDNSTISNNEGTETGGLNYMQNSPTGSVVLTDVFFKDNVCSEGILSRRVSDFIFYFDTGISDRQFFDCFSTSALPRCGKLMSTSVFPDLIGPSIISVDQTIQENEKGDGYEITLSFVGVFTGTNRKYDVILEAADGTRLVAESISFNKTGGTATVSLGNPSISSLSPSTKYTIIDVKKSASESTSNEFIFEGETEPDWKLWHHSSDSKAHNMTGLSFTTPYGPSLSSIDARLNPSNLNEATVSMIVSFCTAGSFTLIVFDESDSLKKEISIGPFLFSSSTQTSTSRTVVIRPSDQLSYGKNYTVKALSSSTLIISNSAQTFKMPAAPPRISTALASLSGTAKTSVTLTLTGEALPKGKGFTIVVKEMEEDAVKDEAKGISLTGTIEGPIGSTTTTCTASVEIYNKSDTLEYSKKYKIESLEIAGFSCIVDSTVNFTVPDSPGRVEGTEEPDLNGEKTKVNVVVVGVGFTSSISEIVVRRGDQKISSTSITSITATQLTATFGAGKEESETELGFKKSYEIETVTGQSNMFLNSGVGFTVPEPGIVSSTSTELNPATNEEFKVIVNGANFESGTEWILKLTGRSEVISVTMTSTKKGESSWVKAGGPGELEFDQPYTLSKMTQKSNASEHILCSGVSVTTPPGPTLSNIKAELNPSNLNESMVSVTVSPCAAGSFTLIVFDESDALKKEITIGPFLFTSSPTQTSSHTVVIHPSGQLSYGKTYTVKMLSSSTLIVSHSSTPFEVPAAVPRISFAAATLSGTDKTWVDVALTGESLPKGKGFKIVVKEMEGDVIKNGAPEMNLTGTIEGTSGTTTACTASVEIYNKSDTLEYLKKYQIESLEIEGYSCIVDSGVNFTVPDSPGRVEGTEEPDLNGEKTTVTVIVKGVNFPLSMTSMTAKRGSISISSTSIVRNSGSQLTVSFGAGKAETSLLVEFGKTYSIVGVSGGSEVFVNSGVEFTVPVPGIVSSTSTILNPATNEEFKVIVSGKNFESGTEWILKLTDRNEEISVTMTSTKKGESSWVKAGGPGELEFDQPYTLSKMTQKSNASEHILCSGVSVTTPPGPTLTGITCSLNLSNLNEAIVHLTASPIPTGSFTLIVFDASDTLKPEISIGPFFFSSSSTQTSSSCSVVILPSDTLSFEKTFAVRKLSSPSMLVDHASLSLSIPAYPTLTKVDFSFATSSNTTFRLILEGAYLPVGEVFLVTLDGFDNPIEVAFTNTSGGSSAELALGWSDTLNFSSSYTLSSVIHTVLSTVAIPPTDLTLVTDSHPDPLILYANDSVHSEPKFCGAKERPCSSLDVAWMIVEAYSARAVSLVLINKTLLSSPISIGAGQAVIVKPHLLPPTLVIPSTASLGDSTGLVSVAGSLVLERVNIDVQMEALSFVLFDVRNGALAMDFVHISGVPSSSELIDGIDGLCAWETGLIKLHNSSAEIENCRMSSIEMGEIWMESSNLSLISTQILSNGARFSSFPSAQQDVMCKSGNISILPSASDTTEDHWISSLSECSVTLNGSELKSPHSVPSLDAKVCTSTQSKKKDSFSVSIVGSKLIPCGLTLEV